MINGTTGTLAAIGAIELASGEVVIGALIESAPQDLKYLANLFGERVTIAAALPGPVAAAGQIGGGNG